MISIAIRFAGVRMVQIVDTIVGLAEENESGPNALTESDWDLRSLLILRPLMKRHGVNECLYVYA